MKLLIISMGPGETGQGLALAKFAWSSGHKVEYILLRNENLGFLSGSKFPYSCIEDPKKIFSKISKGSYDIIVLCNSKMFQSQPEFQQNGPEKRPLVVSIDSNWLFNSLEYPFVQWLDHIFINLPKKVYENGLKKNGGNYSIPPHIEEKVTPVGLIPSYKSPSLIQKLKIRRQLGISRGQKLVFVYMGTGITFRKDVHKTYLSVAEEIYKKYGKKIKFFFPDHMSKDEPWSLYTKKKLDSQSFFQILASSDMVFQHQGLGTLEQAISARVPAICLVTKPKVDEKVHCHEWEIKPFVKEGLCKLHYVSDPSEEIFKSLEELMFNLKASSQMRKKQKLSYGAGEANLLLKLDSLVKNSSHESTNAEDVMNKKKEYKD